MSTAEPLDTPPRILRFTVAGYAVTQGSKTAINVGGRAILREGSSKAAHDRWADWRHAVATEARASMYNQPMYRGAILANLTFWLQRPNSAPKRRRTYPIGAKSGDVDKYARAVLDACTGIVFANDAQVLGMTVTKDYGSPGLAVEIMSITEPDVDWEPTWRQVPRKPRLP